MWCCILDFTIFSENKQIDNNKNKINPMYQSKCIVGYVGARTHPRDIHPRTLPPGHSPPPPPPPPQDNNPLG